jgi:cell wall-associated NlpC family hydrolase
MERWIEDLIGVPYAEYGNTPEEGFHCAGLCRYVLQRKYGVDLPTDPLKWRTLIRTIDWPQEPLDDYDIVLMRGPTDSHIGLALGGKDVLHSWQPAGGVVLMRLERLAPIIEEVGRLKR